MEKAELEARLSSYVGTTTGPPFAAPDAVNESMIRHWCEAMGDRLAVYTDAEAAQQSVHRGLVAPPQRLEEQLLVDIDLGHFRCSSGSARPQGNW